MKKFYQRGIVAAAALILSACSGGSNGGGNSNAPAAKSPQPVSVGVLLTDAYGTRWDQALATVTSIELIGDNGHETLFIGEETIDLLSLRDYSELFAVAEIFPATFVKARLQLALLELVDLDVMGDEIERVTTKLVGNGKMDINFDEPIVLFGGESLLIEIDADMNKAFKTTETDSGKVIVRPVIHARVLVDGATNRMVRVFGVVESVDGDEQTFVLCQAGLVAHNDDDDDDDEFDHCLVVATDELTAVFNAEGLPVTFADIAPEMELTAVGFLRAVSDDGEAESADDDDDDFEDDFVLDAVAIEIGNEFGRFAGTVQSAVDGTLFDFLFADGQGFDPGTVITTELFANTRVFLRDGTELDQLAIVPDATGIIDGIVVPGGEGGDDLLRAALIVLDPEEPATEDLLAGTVISPPNEAGVFDMLVGETPRCVDASGADIELISDSDGLTSEPGDLTDIVAEVDVDAFGEEDTGGCFVASSISVHVDDE